MHKSKLPTIIILAGILLLALFLAFRMGWFGKNINWAESYQNNKKNPYDTYIFHQLVRTKPGVTVQPIDKKVSTQLPANGRGSYLCVGAAVYQDSADVKRLLRFIKNGGKAFFITKVTPYALLFEAYPESCENVFWDSYPAFYDTAATVYLETNVVGAYTPQRFRHLQNFRPMSYNWPYISSKYFCNASGGMEQLGTIQNENQINYARLPYGKGYIYLHTTPLLFSNYYMNQRKGFEYASLAMRFLPTGTVYWDTYSLVSEWEGNRQNENNGARRNQLPEKSPLSYILSKPPLAWAWYILLGGLVLFMIFRAKRQQRIIPVLAAPKNTSKEFIETISKLYLTNEGNPSIGAKAMRAFLEHARTRYGIHSRDADEAFVKALARKAEVDESLVAEIAENGRRMLISTFVTDKNLIDFHILLERFYEKAK